MTSEVSVEQRLGVFAHYQIIRRNGAVVPFEPSAIADAMMKAFLVVQRTMPRWKRFRVSLYEHAAVLFERMFCWKSEAQSSTFAVEWAAAVHSFSRRRSLGTGVPLGTGVGYGFFSAAKPNLRNAP